MTMHRVPSAGEPLTDRELGVLEMMAEGLSNALIGRRAFLAEYTVKTHVSRILRKLGAANRVEAVAIGHRLGLLRDGTASKPALKRPAVPAPVEVPVVVSQPGLDELAAVAEALLAGRPLSSVRRDALVALTVAGRRGPGGRPLPQGAAPVSVPASRAPGDLRAGNGTSRASQAASVALRPLPAAIPSRPSGADAPQPTNGAQP